MSRLFKIAVSAALTVAAIAAVLASTDIGGIAQACRQLSMLQVGTVAAVLLTGALLASLRVRMIAGDLGYFLSMRDAVAVLSIGQLAGGLFFQLVGQLVARGALLARRGLPVAVAVVLTGYERIVALAVSLALALAGAWLIFGRIAIDLDHGGLEFFKLTTGLILSVAAGAIFGWGRKATRAFNPRFSARVALRALRSVAISLAIQLCTMAAYVIMAKALAPDIPTADLSAAAAVVMLAASLPISLAGWGVREVSAVFALGAIGMAPEKALIVALVVGIGSMAVVAILALFSVGAWYRPATESNADRGSAPTVDFAAMLTWFLPLAAATAVFFQVYVPVGGGRLNVNFADPVAILGGVLLLVWAVRDRALPHWRLTWFNAHVVVASMAFALALMIGWAHFGWTSWALTNKFAGWFVLLAYGATGALLVSRMGHDGLTMLMRTITAVAAAIALCDIVLILLRSGGIPVSAELLLYQAQGFALNRNAFAFQLVLAAIPALLMFRSSRLSVVLLGIILSGLWFAGSRAAFGTAVVVFALGAALRPMAWKRLPLALSGAGVIVVFIIYLPYVSDLVAELMSPKTVQNAQPAATAAAGVSYGLFANDPAKSDAERFYTLAEAWKLFLAQPVFGAGLGAFVEQHLRATGQFLVIHSTPLWLLAEFGIAGTLAVAAPLARIAWREVKPLRRTDDAGVILLLIIAALAVMSLVHEMMYQRLFWLMLGAGLALVSPVPLSDKGSLRQ